MSSQVHLPWYLEGERPELRRSIETWVAEHPEPTPADVATAGFVAPNFPAPWGFNADLVDQLVLLDVLSEAGVTVPFYSLEQGWIGPSLLIAGSEAQRDRYLWPMLKGEERWCRLHSEPDAGSDLAQIATRAVFDEEIGSYVVTGQKIWTANAVGANFGALLARTSGRRGDPEGISYFVVDMTQPGVTVRPITDFRGVSIVNEVFLDEVVLPADNLIGAPGQGLRIRRPTYRRRLSLFRVGMFAGHGPSVYDLLPLLDEAYVPEHFKDRLLDLYLQAQSLDSLTLVDAYEERSRGEPSDFRTDVRRLLLQEHGLAALEFVHELNQALTAAGVTGRFPLLDHPALAAAISMVPFAILPAGTSDLHRESIAARLFGGDSPVLRSWAGEA